MKRTLRAEWREERAAVSSSKGPRDAWELMEAGRRVIPAVRGARLWFSYPSPWEPQLAGAEWPLCPSWGGGGGSETHGPPITQPINQSINQSRADITKTAGLVYVLLRQIKVNLHVQVFSTDYNLHFLLK